MKKSLHKIFVIALAAIMCTMVGCTKNGSISTPPSEVNVQIKSALNTVKVLRDDGIDSLSDAKLSFEAAKGETEGAQIVLRSDGEATFDVTVSDLKSSAGDKIPASAVTVYVQRYMQTTLSYTGFAKGAYPDALIPLTYSKQKGENVLHASENQGLWFDLKVPADAAAGEYSGAYTVTVGKETFNVPVSVTVYDFEMPSAPAIPTTYLIWQDWLMDSELDNTAKKYGDYYDMLLDYNITAYYFPADIGDIDGFVECLRNYYDSVASYGVPYRKKDEAYGRSLDFTLLEEYLAAIMQASKEDGVNYFEKAYYYFDYAYDELFAHSFEENGDVDLARLSRIITETNSVEEAVAATTENAELKSSVKGLRHMLTLITGYNGSLSQFKDELTICPIFNNVASTDNIDMYSDLIEKGYSITSYGSTSFWPYGAHLIDDYMITSRDVFWSKFGYRLNGDLYWCVNACCNYSKPLLSGYARIDDPYTEPSRDGMSSGDGYLVYPGAPYGSEKPFPSLRLTATRDGIDDYTYLSMLEDEWNTLADKYGVPKDKIHAAIQTLSESVYATGVSKLNFKGLQDARRTIARLIEMAKSPAGVLISDFSYDENGVNYTVCVANSTDLKINGGTPAANATETGNGIKVSVTKAEYPENGVMTVSAGNTTAEIAVGKAFDTVVALDKEDDANAYHVSTLYGGTTTFETSAHTEHGNTVKATLKGHIFDSDMQTLAYRPSVQFDVANLDQADTLSFWVYNDGEEIAVNIIARDEDGILTVADMVTLPAYGWRKITVKNFTYISRQASALKKINRMGIDCANLVENGEENSHTFYISSVCGRDK